jgi:hypothetical protein
LSSYVQSLPVGRTLALTPRADYRGGRVVITTSDGEVRLPAGTASVFDPVKTPSGWTFWGHSDGFTGGGPDQGQELYLLGPGNRLSTLHHGPFDGVAMSPDGTRFAVAELTLGATDPVKVVVRTLAGAVRASTTLPVGSRVSGWTVDGVLLSRTPPGADHPQFHWWAPGSELGAALPYRNVVPVATDPATVVVNTEPGRQGAPSCWHTLALRSGALGPEVGCSSTENRVTVSPDGRYAVIASTAYHLATGAPGRPLLGNRDAPFFAWEDATHAVVFVGDPTLYARCDVTTGVCERAPAPVLDGKQVTVAWYR